MAGSTRAIIATIPGEGGSYYTIEAVEPSRLSALEIRQIAHVCEEVLYQEIRCSANAALDTDLQNPASYYGDAVRGALFVARRHAPAAAAIAAAAATCGQGEGEGASGNTTVIVGLIGLRRLAASASPFVGPNTCEMKRWFLLREHRGAAGVGLALFNACVAQAAALGYSRMVLDTRLVLKAAGRVYDRNGFVEWGSYNDNLRADRFMALNLTQWRPRLTPARGVVAKL